MASSFRPTKKQRETMRQRFDEAKEELGRHRWSGHSARDQLGSLDFPEEHE